MRFHADLHVHSRHSRATSRDLDLEHLAAWGARKGIGVVATGDFTHPVWRAELRDKLVADTPGLFRLREDIAAGVTASLPPACRTLPRFMLEVEISTIYKKGDKTRKIHHLIYAPDFATVDRISDALARIGNIASDGRPILGLDSRNLLEITLESSPDAYLVPAHIWTPWFAALGSQSGFDSIAECYGDLADHIFAVETGLSSDPPMNWRLSMLDRFRLVSNSDAHSPGKLGREATTFDCEPDYFAIRKALETGDGFVGTVEFFPEEGKYHLDGHRKCEVKLSPHETLANGGRCPVCGGALTIGVQHRVEALADRSEEDAAPPPTAGEVSNLVPLPEMLSEIAASGPSSKAVARRYGEVMTRLGPELDILQKVPVEDIARADNELLAEAILRLRAGKVIRDAGYDGEYGVIRMFEAGELLRKTSGGMLFAEPTAKGRADTSERTNETPNRHAEVRGREAVEPRSTAQASFEGRLQRPPQDDAKSGILTSLDADQRAAAEIVDRPLLIVAGPGSGKTRALTHRIAHLVADCGVPAQNCLAITFTRRAAAEMKERLAQLLPGNAAPVAIHTFHSLGLAILREHAKAAGLQRGFHIADEAERVSALAAVLKVPKPRALSLLRAISNTGRAQLPSSGEVADAHAAYLDVLLVNNWIDFDALVARAAQLLAADAGIAALYRDRFRFICADEFQDVDAQQYRLVTLLAPPPEGNLCAIGDPHQAIYGFRGADASCFERFKRDYPRAVTAGLKRNYRSSGTIVTASSQVVRPPDGETIVEIVRAMDERITIHVAPTERAEAEFVVASIEQAIGGHSFFSIDSGRASGGARSMSFADIAVLYRTDAQSAALVEAFARSGIPFKKHAHSPLSDDPFVRSLLGALDDPPASAPAGTQQHAVQSELDSRLRGNERGALTAQLAKAADRVGSTDDAASIQITLQRLTALAEASGNDPVRFLDAVALASEADFYDSRSDRVSLLTLHAAKGLEFALVFIVGLEDGLLPLHWGAADEAEVDEERRLFYVGMTRAKDRLLLSRALRRRLLGRAREQAPSRFLADIESALVKHQKTELLRRPEERQLKLF
jgi:uncharacterized protein (TIGR00375 family)